MWDHVVKFASIALNVGIEFGRLDVRCKEPKSVDTKSSIVSWADFWGLWVPFSK